MMKRQFHQNPYFLEEIYKQIRAKYRIISVKYAVRLKQ